MTFLARVLLLALFFLSGASGLVFENLWQRSLVLEFGSAAIGTNAVLTAIFVGIALGGYGGGKILQRVKNAALFYGVCELGIGLFGLAVPYLLVAIRIPYVPLAANLGPGTLFGFVVRFTSAILVTLPATLCMGATIPAMNRILAEQRRIVATSVSLAFGLNTLGAVLGCLIPGLILLPRVGVARSFWIAALIDVTLALIALGISRFVIPPHWTSAAMEIPTAKSSARLRFPRLLAAGYFLAGALALGYEVLWFRVLAIYSTSSWLTFAIVLCVYLLGFGCGSLILFPILAKRLDACAIFSLSNICVGASVIALMPLSYGFPEVTRQFIFDLVGNSSVSLSLSRVILVELLFAGVLVLLPSLFLGVAYPAVCGALVASIGDVAPTSGALFFLGNLGAACGVLFVGLLVVPVCGLTTTVAVLSIGSLLLGGVSAVAENRFPFYSRRLTAAMIGCIFVGAVSFAVYGKPFTKDDMNRAAILRYQAGETGTVMVHEERPAESPPYRVISVDGHSVAGTNMGNAIDAKMLAHIPLMLHRSPKRALTVGFGTGGTSWSMVQYPIRVDCVEIEREVVLSEGLFREQNNNVLAHPRFHLILNDARDYLLTTDAQYDVIATDVTQLQYKHNSSLYTLDYFQLMKLRLARNGIACAWIPMGGISQTEFKTLLRTFLTAFPNASMWYMNHSATQFGILIGTPNRLSMDTNRIRDLFAEPDTAADLKLIGISDPLQIIHFLHLDQDRLRDFVGEGALHTDDRPVLEFSSPLSSFQVRRFAHILKATLPFRKQSYHDVVQHWPAQDRELLDRYSLSSRRMTEAIAKFYEGEQEPDPRQSASLLRDAVGLAREAIGPFRNESTRMFWFNEMVLALNRIEKGAGSPESTRLQIKDDFEAAMYLPLYPQVGRARPTDDARLVQQWSAQMRQLVERSRFVSGAGRNASTAFQLAPPDHAALVGFFSPLPVQPNRTYKVSFWMKGELGEQAESGMVIVEFADCVPTGEQIPDFVMSETAPVLHGPYGRAGVFDWQQSTIQFRTGVQTKMIHLILFLRNSVPGERVWFDHLEVQQLN